MKILAVLCVLLLLPATAAAQVTAEKVLLPIVLDRAPVPGAHGSQWTTSLWISNTADQPVLIWHYDYGCMLVLCSQPPTPPGTSFRPTNSALLPVPGIFLYVDRAHADAVAFSLRVQDISRQAQTWGTEIPIVRERDWRSRITLLDVPVTAGFRNLLRIYEYSDETVVPVRIRIYGISPDQRHPLSAAADPLLGETTLQVLPITAYHPRTPPEGPVARGYYPGYAQLADFPGSAPARGHDRIRIDVESLSPGKMIWAFVAVTNDVTQHVTLVTPQ